MQITGSIVLYKNSPAAVSKTIESFMNVSLERKLLLIDNSPTDELRTLTTLNENIEYTKTKKNIGFGKAHNIALSRSQEIGAKYHVVLNPDVSFERGNIEKIFDFCEENPNVGLVSPKIVYPDGTLQTLCKLLPTPGDLFIRRFLGFTSYARKRKRTYELHDSEYNKIMNIPYLSGCFMFLRNDVIKEIGGFEEKIFMYIEDADLTRRIFKNSASIFYPHAKIIHEYQKGSYKNFRLMLYNIHGAIVYFNKWGWFFDKERKQINQRVINDYLQKQSD